MSQKQNSQQELSDERLFAYFDGQLSEAEAAEVQAILNRNPKAFRLYITLLKLKAVEPTPEDLANFEQEHDFTPSDEIVAHLKLPKKKARENLNEMFMRLKPIWNWLQKFTPPTKKK